jgi:membrane-bound serine protease (ClpP class)
MWHVSSQVFNLPMAAPATPILNIHIIQQEMTALQRALDLVVDPSIAIILLTLGIVGILIEIRTPGLNIAGLFGIICLSLSFYGLAQLGASLTGVVLMVIAVAFFIWEVFTPTFGLLAAGGIIAFLLGGALLFNRPDVATPWTTLIILAILLGGLVLLIAYAALRAQRRPALTGTEGLIGEVGVTKNAFGAGETGSVFVYGEWWNARIAEGEVAANMPVRVLNRERMTLVVAPIHNEPTVVVVGPSAPTAQLTQSDENPIKSND